MSSGGVFILNKVAAGCLAVAFFAVAGQVHESYRKYRVQEALHDPDSRVFSVERQRLDVFLHLGRSLDDAVRVHCRTIFRAASGTSSDVLRDGVRACSWRSAHELR